MAKNKSEDAPAMEGKVSRGVDFNLKKEDLMLLILEGRKEIMEEEIGKLQTTSTQLREKLIKAQELLRVKVDKLVRKTLNAEAKKLMTTFSAVKEGEEDEDNHSFSISLRDSTESIGYIRYSANPIGDGKGGAYIKTQRVSDITFNLYHKVTIKVSLSMNGKVYGNKSEIFANKDYVRACTEYSHDFTILEQDLDTKYQLTLPEGQELTRISTELSKNEGLLSDILAEYDLFNRNQPRAKAKMIKEVLGRDEAGLALLENITAAAGGVKLLG